MIPLASARIGYAGYSRDFSSPGDRRRFSAYAGQRNLSYEYPTLDGDYDLVLITQNADLTGWTARKRKDGERLRLVLDLVDPYFEQRRLDERLLKGMGRYFERRDSRLSIDFRETLKQACRATDAVLCSTPEQRETILQFNPNVEISFDWFDEELGQPKAAFGRKDRLKLVWEGQAGTLRSIQAIREPLNALRDDIELHVVTDPSVPRWYGRLGTLSATELLAGIECPITFSRWEKDTFSENITKADIAVIPMDLSHPMFRAKPENKLVLLWKLGMPVLAGPTAAYQRAMGAANLPMVCKNEGEWLEKFRWLLGLAPQELAALGARGRRHATTVYDAQAFRLPFDRAFKSIGFAI